MEARLIRAAMLVAILIVSMGATYRTPNFVIETESPKLAEEFGKTAEKLRHEMAIMWLGRTMPRWSEPCPVTIEVGPRLGAGGATTFVFNKGEVYGWRMTIQGSRQRVLDSVLPHEITHMVFASHFRCPLPRWADEGGATSVEHHSELDKHRKMLVQFLRGKRGIAFNRMFSMTDYPRDIMPLYAQGFTLCEFLVQQGGRREFIEYLGRGLEDGRWDAATKEHYGYGSLGELQNAWVAWAGRGFPPIERPIDRPVGKSEPQVLLAGSKPSRPQPNLIWRMGRKGKAVAVGAKVGGNRYSAAPRAISGTEPPAGGDKSSVLTTSGWRAVKDGLSDIAAVARAAPMPSSQPIRAELSHPQPVEKSRQIIMEWHK
jgi:hypothetical protein